MPSPCLLPFAALSQPGMPVPTPSSSGQCSRLSCPKPGGTGQKPDPATQARVGSGKSLDVPVTLSHHL